MCNQPLQRIRSRPFDPCANTVPHAYIWEKNERVDVLCVQVNVDTHNLALLYSSSRLYKRRVTWKRLKAISDCYQQGQRATLEKKNEGKARQMREHKSQLRLVSCQLASYKCNRQQRWYKSRGRYRGKEISITEQKCSCECACKQTETRQPEPQTFRIRFIKQITKMGNEKHKSQNVFHSFDMCLAYELKRWKSNRNMPVHQICKHRKPSPVSSVNEILFAQKGIWLV